MLRSSDWRRLNNILLLGALHVLFLGGSLKGVGQLDSATLVDQYWQKTTTTFLDTAAKGVYPYVNTIHFKSDGTYNDDLWDWAFHRTGTWHVINDTAVAIEWEGESPYNRTWVGMIKVTEDELCVIQGTSNGPQVLDTITFKKVKSIEELTAQYQEASVSALVKEKEWILINPLEEEEQVLVYEQATKQLSLNGSKVSHRIRVLDEGRRWVLFYGMKGLPYPVPMLYFEILSMNKDEIKVRMHGFGRMKTDEMLFLPK